MKKPSWNDLSRIIFVWTLLCPLILKTEGQTSNSELEFDIQIDGLTRFQQIDGFGVNANTYSWHGNELEPAVNLLLDSMNATIWRVIVETVVMWEDVNDNDDPFRFNWNYYNKLYETPKFKKAWEMIQYLNNKGITDNLMINFMGPVPSWMGTGEVTKLKLGGDIIEPRYEDEYVEMIVSFFYYAKNVKHLQFGLVSPFNETDHNGMEGPKVESQQYARILKKLIERMKNVGMSEINYVGPDGASMNKGIKQYIPIMMEDSTIISKIAHFGLHSYGGYYADVNKALLESAFPKSSFWITEWNEWGDGLDDGYIGVYDYKFASKCVYYLLDLLKNGATAALVWEGYDSYYEHHFPSTFSYWGVLGYTPESKTYSPRKHFFAISQISKFVLPGSWQISVKGADSSLVILAFYDPDSGRVTITGINTKHTPVTIKGEFENLPEMDRLEFYYTDGVKDLYKDNDLMIKENRFEKIIPAESIFTITGNEGESKDASIERIKPEPPDWYAGDMHVHRDCGGPVNGILPESKFIEMMEVNDLAVISVLADMGDAEVKDSKMDLPKVNGKDAPQSIPGRTIHYDAEWHWDPFGTTFEHKALGGHIVLLGLSEAHQIWDESPYKILEYGRKQGGIVGFCHTEYLNDQIQNKLNCCIPIEYPVEAALGTTDFFAEDVFGTTSHNNGNYSADATLNAYYRLLNCGFRLGLAAGTDYPCNGGEPLGTLLTYVNVKEPFTYRKWIEGIKNGKTVVARNGHLEFIDMKINEEYQPGDDIRIENKGNVTVEVKWSSIKPLTGMLELVSNGKVIAQQQGTAKPGEPIILKANMTFEKSGWICARRMDEKGHQTHTGPVYVTVNNQPVRASAEDALYFVKWIDNLLVNTSPGNEWNQYFTDDLKVVQRRYSNAKKIYLRIAKEANKISID